ncbi:hypothetical protein L1887_38705 [Cichorium endivia]|nr:hypothetical protein L1887_38705 [Cichorium endivia]
MSDHICFHIQEEIVKRLSVKALIKFRSVSRAWRSLIDSADIVVAHSLRHAPPHHLLVKYRDRLQREEIYVSIVDDDTFPQQRFVQTLPGSVTRFVPKTIGSSHGLLCLQDGDSKVVLWNPSIRKSIAIQLPAMVYDGFSFFLCFGVCPVTLDPKIVKITQIGQWCEKKNKYSRHWKVMIYTLRSGRWRKLL